MYGFSGNDYVCVMLKIIYNKLLIICSYIVILYISIPMQSYFSSHFDNFIWACFTAMMIFACIIYFMFSGIYIIFYWGQD